MSKEALHRYVREALDETSIPLAAYAAIPLILKQWPEIVTKEDIVSALAPNNSQNRFFVTLQRLEKKGVIERQYKQVNGQGGVRVHFYLTEKAQEMKWLEDEHLLHWLSRIYCALEKENNNMFTLKILLILLEIDSRISAEFEEIEHIFFKTWGTWHQTKQVMIKAGLLSKGRKKINTRPGWKDFYTVAPQFTPPETGINR